MVRSFIPEVYTIEIIIGINLSFKDEKIAAQGYQQAGKDED
jgi:hypothetical protein